MAHKLITIQPVSDTYDYRCIHAGSNGTVKLVMALVGKFAVAGSFAIIYLFSAELFPTTVRYGICEWYIQIYHP